MSSNRNDAGIAGGNTSTTDGIAVNALTGAIREERCRAAPPQRPSWGTPASSRSVS